MGRTECLTWVDYERAVVGTALFSKSEMALFSERTHTYAQKTLDTADIVRDAIFQQQREPISQCAPLYGAQERQMRFWTSGAEMILGWLWT